jgi:putative membrane-bound dehydrogenase-like protein
MQMLRTTTTMTTTTTIVTLLLAVALIGCHTSSTSRTLPKDASGPGHVTVKDTEGEHLDVLVDGKVATRYMYAHDTSTPERRTQTYKPYLHVFDEDGKAPITNSGDGGEYPHHRGIFIGWNKISYNGKTIDRWHMKGGEIVHQRFADVMNNGKSAMFTSVTNWNDESGKPFIVEERTQTVRTIPAPGRLIIDFTSKLTAPDGDAVLDGDPEHAGIHFRPADTVDRAKTVYLYPQANAQPHKDLDYPWVGATFTLKDTGKTYSVVEFNHPDNPKGTRWSAYRNYGRFGAFPKATLKKGEPLVLKYRFLVADGELVPVQRIERVYNEFAGKHDPVPATTTLPAEQPAPKAATTKPSKPAKPAADAAPQSAKPQPAVEGREARVVAATQPTSKPSKFVNKNNKPKTNRMGPEDAKLVFNPPAQEPFKVEDALKTFTLPPGLKIEAVASEPMVEEPIAISFDARGRAYVVEMRGYMLNVDADHEDDPIGRIKLLEDTDGDGKFDKASVFLDKLVAPRAVMAYRNGAIVGEPPNLAYWEDTDGDGAADKKTVIATNYGIRGGQPEHMANTPIYGIDNWIYSAAHESKYREVRGQWQAMPTAKRGQYGLGQDDVGRMYFTTNSDIGRADPLPADYFTRNPFVKFRDGQNAEIVDSQAVFPSHMTPGVNRGYEPEQLRKDGTLATATAAGGATIYRGGLLPDDFVGNLIVPEPSGNLIKRLIVTSEGGKLSAKDAYENKDFLTSTDERFRPVQVCTGPDGAIYVVDMYKGVLQHFYFLTHYLIANIKARGLESPIHWGRIYRIVPDNATNVSPAKAKLPDDAKGLIAALSSPNGAIRDTAQRVLVERNDKTTASPLKKLATDSSANPLARLHALWTLEGMGRLDEATTKKALGDGDARVRAAAVRMAEPLLAPTTRAQIQPALLKLANDPSPDVQLQLVLSLGPIPDDAVAEIVAGYLTKSAADPDLMRDAALSCLRGRELEFAERLMARSDWETESGDHAETLTDLARCVMAEHRSARVGRLLELVAKEPEGSWRQVALLAGMTPPKANVSATKPTTRPATVSLAVVGKMIYLDDAPDGLPPLLESKSEQVRRLAGWVDARLAWPGKPGVPPPPKVTPLTSEEQARFEHGKEVYALTCAACHQPSGLGLEGLAPPLADSEWAQGPAERVIRIVLQGLTGPISVNGVPYRMEMPALPTLSDTDIASVLTYVRRQPDWEHTASPVDAAMVAKVREQTKSRQVLWTAEELTKVK